MRRRNENVSHLVLRQRVLPLAPFAAVGLLIWLLVTPACDLVGYHPFADQRWCGKIPNCLDVLSNLAFVVAGSWGIVAVVVAGRRELFVDGWIRRVYMTLFVGTIFMAVGSAYYHLAPNDDRLVWDRLTMIVVFASLLTALLAERASLRVARRLFVPLLVLGASSVVYWHWTVARGHGDIRPYGIFQFGSLFVVLLLVTLWPERYDGDRYLVGVLVASVLAKLFEAADARIWGLGNVVSGHTLKHLAAAGGVACVAAMLRARRHRMQATVS